ncbi:MAG TPA: carboxymuconolactone decarboxylase family protein [Candidatus Dormibacteraeota bacterium]|nr:carboxymuconolactone decarboxylase family protein [Candidatus Dormibacteraeota bacterium]
MAAYREKLRRLALNDERFLERVLSHTDREAAERSLDERSCALTQLGALVALRGPQAAFDSLVCSALAAGLGPEELVDALVALTPVVGTAQAVAAAPKLATSIGYDLDFALERLDPDEDGA